LFWKKMQKKAPVTKCYWRLMLSQYVAACVITT